MSREILQDDSDYLVTTRSGNVARIECRKAGRESVAEVALEDGGSLVVEIQAAEEPMALGWGHAQVDLGPPALLRSVLDRLVS
jgi:hypothetical protein